MAPSLLGPPETHRSSTASTIATPASSRTTSTDPSDPFMGLLVSKFNSSTVPPTGLTENFSPTFLSSGNPCLDFFFQVVPDTPASVLTSLLQSAWDQNPLAALKLICQLRGVRGKGKSDKEDFYTAALWLHKHHPKTLALNVRCIAEFGYFKDLPEILHRLLYGPDVREIAKKEREKKQRRHGWWRPMKKRKTSENKKNEGTREERLTAEMARLKIEMEEASQLRKKKRADMAKKALDRYNRDPDFRFLHDRIGDLFAGLLQTDLNLLKSGEITRISLAAKWCPSIDSSYDYSTLLCESVARRLFPRRLFPRDSNPEYVHIEDQHYAYRVRDRLRKEVLVPLRKALQLPEVYIGANQWDKIPYSRVASVAMKNYKKLFQKHDRKRFAEYLGRVKQGKAKIAAGALLPHEIVLAACGYEEEDTVAELQWQRMVKDLTEKGKLRNCIAVCDVSGSMSGTPMDVAVALGLLTSELSEEPWKGRVITFSNNPQLNRIAGETLKEKASFVRTMDWGANTNFQKVFDRILTVAVEEKLKEEQMIKRVFVFSDMEFDQASANSWETDYQAIERKFRGSGYGSAVPEIVFWNLRDSRSTPVPSGQKGVALVSGFSKNLMTLFLEGDGVLRPEDVMEAAIAGEEYKSLAVFD